MCSVQTVKLACILYSHELSNFHWKCWERMCGWLVGLLIECEAHRVVLRGRKEWSETFLVVWQWRGEGSSTRIYSWYHFLSLYLLASWWAPPANDSACTRIRSDASSSSDSFSPRSNANCTDNQQSLYDYIIIQEIRSFKYSVCRIKLGLC